MNQVDRGRFHLDTRTEVLLLFAMLNLLDVLTTRLGLVLGIPEGNPIPAAIIAGQGFETFVLVKVVLVLVVSAAPLLLPRFHRIWMAIHFGSAVLALAIANNLVQIIT